MSTSHNNDMNQSDDEFASTGEYDYYSSADEESDDVPFQLDAYPLYLVLSLHYISDDNSLAIFPLQFPEIGDDDLGFDAHTSDHAHKTYQVEYVVRSMDDILTFQSKEAIHVSGIVAIAPTHAATLLRHFNWNKELLMEKYMEDSDRVLREACVVFNDNEAPKPVPIAGFVCDICYDDDPTLESIALSCGHRFCTGCYALYLDEKINQVGESRRIACMAKDCSLVVDQATVKHLVKPKTLSRYETLLLRTYVDDNQFLRWCPAPDCDKAIECHVTKAKLDLVVPTVKCSCGRVFCFGCGMDDHQPCVCSLVKEWQKKCQDDSETANWISANTKECPKCESTIEKNGGCNHMTCKKCRYEWCWVCSGPWSEHGTSYYNCNRFNEETSTVARDAQARSRASLERYLHYYNRFANHDQSARLDRENYTKTEEKMTAMQQQTNLSWIEVQFLKAAVEIAVECRMTLKWTYAFAFYLNRDNMSELFESNQRDLEMAVEQLSGLLESEDLLSPSKIDQARTQIVNKMVYVQQRREVVLIDTADGLREVRWAWTMRQ